MARIRTIKPGFFRSEDVFTCGNAGAGTARWAQPRAAPQPGRRSRGRSAWQPGWSPAFLPSTGARRSMVSIPGMPEVSV